MRINHNDDADLTWSPHGDDTNDDADDADDNYGVCIYSDDVNPNRW